MGIYIHPQWILGGLVLALIVWFVAWLISAFGLPKN